MAKCERCEGIGFIGLLSGAGLTRPFMQGEPEPGYMSCPECLDKGKCPQCGSSTEKPGDPDTRCTKCSWCWEDGLLEGGPFEKKLAEAIEQNRVSW